MPALKLAQGPRQSDQPSITIKKSTKQTQMSNNLLDTIISRLADADAALDLAKARVDELRQLAMD